MTAPIGYPDKFGALLDMQRTDRALAPAQQRDEKHLPIPGGITGAKDLGTSFADQVKEFVSSVNETQKTSATKAEDFATGKSNDIHGTMIAVEQADISLRLLGNVRNKVIDMYREVMRMGS